MKRNIIATLFCLMLCSFTFIRSAEKRIADKQRIEIVFNHKINFDQLVIIKNDLHKKNIELTFKELKFDQENGLTKISFSVDCKNGFKGSASEDHLNNDSKIGFYRDYSKDAASPFGTGDMR